MSLAQSLPTTFTVRVLPLTPITHLDILLTWPSFSGQGRFINLERYRGDQSDIGWYTISDGERDEVTWEKGVCEWGKGLAVPTCQFEGEG